VEVPPEAWERRLRGIERGFREAAERRPYMPLIWKRPEIAEVVPPIELPPRAEELPPELRVPRERPLITPPEMPPLLEGKKPTAMRAVLEEIGEQLRERPVLLPPTTAPWVTEPAPEVVGAPLGAVLEAWRAWKRIPGWRGAIPRSVEAAVGTTLKALAQPAYMIERGLGAVYLASLEHPEVGKLPYARTRLAEYMARRGTLEKQAAISRKLRATDLTPRERLELARTAYTWFADPDRLGLALDDMKQGATIDEVVRKYEHPVPEIIGQIVLDPLNVVGSAVGKLRDVKLLNRVRAQYIEKAAPHVDEAVESLPWFKRVWRAVGGKVGQLNPFRLTANSKARALDRHINSFAGMVLKRAKTPDEAKALLKTFIDAPEQLPPEFGSFVRSPVAEEVRKALKLMNIDSFKSLQVPKAPPGVALPGMEELVAPPEFKLMDFLAELYDKSIAATNQLYDVKPPSTPERWAQGFKNFMADFYMGISPRALIRNAAGNTAFLSYDGLLSFASTKQIDDYMLRCFGFSPMQAQRGLGLAKEYRGPKRGLPIIRNLAELGRRIYTGNIPLLGESWARYRGTYAAMRKFDRLYWRPGALMDLSAFDDIWPKLDPSTKLNLIAAWRQSLNADELLANTDKALEGGLMAARYLDEAEEVSPGFVEAVQEVIDDATRPDGTIDQEKLAQGVADIQAEVEKRLIKAQQVDGVPAAVPEPPSPIARAAVKPKEAARLPEIEHAEELRAGRPPEIAKRMYDTMVREQALFGQTPEGLVLDAQEMGRAAYELDMWEKGDWAVNAWRKHVSAEVPFPRKMTELRRIIEERPDLALKWQDYLIRQMAKRNTPSWQVLQHREEVQDVVRMLPLEEVEDIVKARPTAKEELEALIGPLPEFEVVEGMPAPDDIGELARRAGVDPETAGAGEWERVLRYAERELQYHEMRMSPEGIDSLVAKAAARKPEVGEVAGKAVTVRRGRMGRKARQAYRQSLKPADMTWKQFYKHHGEQAEKYADLIEELEGILAAEADDMTRWAAHLGERAIGERYYDDMGFLTSVERVPVDNITGPEFEKALETGELTVEPVKRRYVEEYVARIKAGEMPPPLKAFSPRPGKDEPYQLIDGHRRLLAAKRAGLKEVLVEVTHVDENGRPIRRVLEDIPDLPENAAEVTRVAAGLPPKAELTLEEALEAARKLDDPDEIVELAQKYGHDATGPGHRSEFYIAAAQRLDEEGRADEALAVMERGLAEGHVSHAQFGTWEATREVGPEVTELTPDELRQLTSILTRMETPEAFRRGEAVTDAERALVERAEALGYIEFDPATRSYRLTEKALPVEAPKVAKGLEEDVAEYRRLMGDRVARGMVGEDYFKRLEASLRQRLGDQFDEVMRRVSYGESPDLVLRDMGFLPEVDAEQKAKRYAALLREAGHTKTVQYEQVAGTPLEAAFIRHEASEYDEIVRLLGREPTVERPQRDSRGAACGQGPPESA
jgi:hypothetical protein